MKATKHHHFFLTGRRILCLCSSHPVAPETRCSSGTSVIKLFTLFYSKIVHCLTSSLLVLNGGLSDWILYGSGRF